jgi:uncharacterized membrane protein YeaQ/YmgE (transglycosylase-associated protein family)
VFLFQAQERHVDPILTFILILVIGIAVGVFFQRWQPPGWLTRQVAGGMRGDVTAALVGIAGAFIGVHLLALAGLISTGAVVAGAVVGAIIVVFAWRSLR